MNDPMWFLGRMLRGEFLEGLPTIPPSSYSWIFPPPSAMMDFRKIDQSALEGKFPSIQGLAPAIFFSLLFGAIRLLLHHTAFEPLAMYAMKLSPIKQANDEEIDSGLQFPYRMSQIVHKFHKIDKVKLNEEISAFCSGSRKTRAEVDSYIWSKRRAAQQQRKIIKYVEALWRFFFYASFCVIGFYTLFSPERVAWIKDTNQFWNGWPLEHTMSDAIRLYYQVELGSYLHQLMWTEVSRSDAMEMMLHHLTTILLIGLSYITNYTRVGVTIMLLHDTADVFLESAKVFNYSSKPKGHEWAKVVCDILFAIFALTFFVTRLILYPLYIISSVLREAPIYFGVNWLGFWLFSSLLVILQGLHVFWFYLIARMLYRLVTTGIEKDERSDDEDEVDEEVVGNGAASRVRSKSYELSSGKISGLSSPTRKKDQ